MTPQTQTPVIVETSDWAAYDAAAEWCARKGLKGQIGDPLPNLMSLSTVNLINGDPEAFERRVRQCAYALAMPVIVETDYVTCSCRAVVQIGQQCPQCGKEV